MKPNVTFISYFSPPPCSRTLFHEKNELSINLRSTGRALSLPTTSVEVTLNAYIHQNLFFFNF